MTSAVQPLTRHMFNAEHRRAERDEVSFAAQLTRLDGALQVQVVNLSPLGFMVRAEEAVTERAKVTLALPTLGAVRATTVWCLGGRIGGEFASPIDPAAYARMLAAARLLRPSWPAV